MDLRFIVCMIYSFVTMNIPFVLLYIFLGDVLLFSAYSLWEKDKKTIGGNAEWTARHFFP